MNELVQDLCNRCNLSEQQAQQVVNYLQQNSDKLNQIIGGQGFGKAGGGAGRTGGGGNPVGGGNRT